MKAKSVLGTMTALACLCGAAMAQDDDAIYVYATYYECGAGTQEIADALVLHSMAPAYDAAVGDGTISSWGWMAHATGGKWRRLMYWSVDSQEGLIDVPAAIDEKMEELGGPGADGLGVLCPLHEDYVWRTLSGSVPADEIGERGKAGFSIYFECDSSRETRADELVEKVFAPVYDKQVEAGNIASWGWMEHFIGGKYRRIATMTGNDHKAVLKARNAVIAELDESQEKAFDEFDSICGSHSDYMWDIVHEKP